MSSPWTRCTGVKRWHLLGLVLLTVIFLLGTSAYVRPPCFPVGSCVSAGLFDRSNVLRSNLGSGEIMFPSVGNDELGLKQLLETCSMKPFSEPISGSEKYVVVSTLQEQLGKARAHLGEILAITHHLQRRLVLPRVGWSSIGMEYDLPFCAYFDEDFLGRYVPWVSDEYFWAHIMKAGAHRRLSVTFVSISWDSSQLCPLRASDIPQVTLNQTGLLPESSLDSICVEEPPEDASEESREEAQRQLFVKLDTRRNVDVLVIVKRSYHFLTPPAFRSKGDRRLRQPNRIHDAVKLMRQRLGPDYIAIQWRMEGASSDKVVCARALVRYVEELVEARKGREPGVFFAADLPYNGIRSSSFAEISSNDKAGYEYVIDRLHPYMWGEAFPEVEELDSGILSLLDKWICAEAETFLRGPDGCARGGTFEWSILEERDLLGRKEVVVWPSE